MSTAPRPIPPDIELPTTPSLEAWRAMSATHREQWLVQALDVLNAHERSFMSEGIPHSTAVANIRRTLGDFFDRVGRTILLASNLPVYYPEETVFSPDLIAVRDVACDEQNDTRMGWVVADEGRGVDLALEVLHSGDRQKDLIDNVARFARLGIPEYFVYDRKRALLYGYRLPTPASTRYEAMPSRRGPLRSRVLGLDLDIVDGRLRFFYGEALVPEGPELLRRLHTKLVDIEARADEAERLARFEAERAQAEAVRAQAEAERAQAEAERAQAEAVRAQAEAERADAEAAARASAEARVAELERRLAELLKGSS